MTDNNIITIHEGEIYAGQPGAEHSLLAHDDRNTIIIECLVRKDTFFQSFLPMLSTNFSLLDFLLQPSLSYTGSKFFHFPIGAESSIRQLIELMVIEYVRANHNSQPVIKSLALSYITLISQQYAALEYPLYGDLIDHIIQYISGNLALVSLKLLSERFSLHPNYISTLIPQKTGMTFSQLKRKMPMERALFLLKNTSLTTEEIAITLGYAAKSNFFREFKAFYGTTPKKFASG